MASPEHPQAVENLREALGISAACLAKWNAPSGLIRDPIYRKLLLAFIGWSTTGEPLDWEPRKVFLDVLREPRKHGFLGTIAWAAHIYYRVTATKANDFELLLKLLNFLENYLTYTPEATAHARAEVDQRLREKLADAAWTHYHRQLTGHAKRLFERKQRPICEAKGYSPEDIAELLAVDWAEHLRVLRDNSLARRSSPRRDYPPRYEGARGITPEERQYARTLAESIKDGDGINWGVLTQLRAPAYPNQFTKEDYFRLATLQIIKDSERTRGPLRGLPSDDDLTSAEKSLARRIRAKVLGGKDFDWCSYLGKVGSRYPNALSKRQLLVLASELETIPRDEPVEQPAQSPSAAYFSAQE